MNHIMIKYWYFLIGLLFTLYNTLAQSVTPQVIGAAGAYSASGNLQLSWTVGETLTTQLSTPTLSASQGFQQNFTICVSIVDYKYVKAGNPYQSLFPLTDNMVINQIPEQVSILVTDACDNVNIESFELDIQGPDLNWKILQNVAPITLFDNFGDDFYGRNFVPGNYSLTVTGYAEDNKGGAILYGPVITNFTVVGNLVTISMPTLSSSSICAGSTIDVGFTTTGTFSPDNKFQIQLSEPDGNFGYPTILATTLTAGTIPVTIPANAPGSDNYRLRVVATKQAYAGTPVINRLAVSPISKYLYNPYDNISDAVNQKVKSTIIADNHLESSSVVNYQAGNAIILNSGFEVKAGAVFKAEIKACGN